jgi:hypothetical protein
MLSLVVNMTRPTLAPLASAHGRAKSGEVTKNKKASDQGRVKKTARASGLFKEAEGRPSTSYPAHRTVEEFNKQFKPPENESGN